MDLRQLNSTELAHLQTLIGRIQSSQSHQTTSQPTGARTGDVSSMPGHLPLMPSESPIPSALPVANTIGPYQSVRMPSVPQAPHGHPSQAMIQMSTGPSQPFLGRNSLAISMSDQVNQQRRASAANHPRQPRLPSRGRRRGPVVQPPSLPRHHNGQQIEDCLSMSNIEIPTIRVKVKVYPPTVRTNCHFCCIALFTKSYGPDRKLMSKI